MVAWRGGTFESRIAVNAWWTAAARRLDGLRAGKILAARLKLARGSYGKAGVLDTTVERILADLSEGVDRKSG